RRATRGAGPRAIATSCSSSVRGSSQQLLEPLAQLVVAEAFRHGTLSLEQAAGELGPGLLPQLRPAGDQVAHELRALEAEALDPSARRRVVERVGVALVVDEQRARGDVADAHALLRQHRRDEPDDVQERQRIDEPEKVTDEQWTDPRHA